MNNTDSKTKTSPTEMLIELCDWSTQDLGDYARDPNAPSLRRVLATLVLESRCDPDPKVRQSAAKIIMDRIEGRPHQRRAIEFDPPLRRSRIIIEHCRETENSMCDHPSTNRQNGRDASGRFAKGNSGGPGNPYARRTARLRSLIAESVSDDDLQEIVSKLVDDAKQGDQAAVKLLLSYLVGKPGDAPRSGPGGR